jgi:uncharacterized protein (TIGR03437 family)
VSPDTYETVEISANAQNLPPGKYQGNVAFVAPSGAPPINLPVIFTVTDSVLPTVAPRLPLAISLVNGASLSFGAIAPGELVSIFGAGLAATPGLQVLIDGLAAQVLPVSPWQVNAVVPNELAPQGLATIEVQNNGGRFVTSLNAASAAPGIVTADGTGIGTAQGFTTPAARGSVAKLFVTGIGETNSRKRLSIPRIAITIGGIEVPAEKIHALGNGIYEMEFLIPTTVSPSAAVPIVVSVGSHASQPGVTVPVS